MPNTLDAMQTTLNAMRIFGDAIKLFGYAIKLVRITFSFSLIAFRLFVDATSVSFITFVKTLFMMKYILDVMEKTLVTMKNI